MGISLKWENKAHTNVFDATFFLNVNVNALEVFDFNSQRPIKV